MQRYYIIISVKPSHEQNIKKYIHVSTSRIHDISKLIISGGKVLELQAPERVTISRQHQMEYHYDIIWNTIDTPCDVSLIHQCSTVPLVSLQFIVRTILLMKSSLFPWSPPSTKWFVFTLIPPVGLLSLKGHRKLLAFLKFSPTVNIS